MPQSSEVESYSGLMKLYHWLVALLVLAQILVGFFRGYIAEQSVRTNLMMLHKSFGLTLVVVSLLFMICGIFSRKPMWPQAMPAWKRFCARVVHTLLYLITFVMAVSGWCMSTAAGYTPSWFGFVSIAAPWVPQSKPLAHVFSTVHSCCAWVLVVLVGIHLLAALKHQFLERDHILRRMMPM